MELTSISNHKKQTTLKADGQPCNGKALPSAFNLNITKKGDFMFFNVLKAKDIVDLKESKFEKETLLVDEESSLNIIALKKDEVIDTHTSARDAAVYVIDGEIELHFDAEKFTVDKGELLMFKKDKEHKVLAKKDSKFFVIKI